MKQETIERIRKFSEDRDWDQFHSPANLAKSIVIEAGNPLITLETVPNATPASRATSFIVGAEFLFLIIALWGT